MEVEEYKKLSEAALAKSHRLQGLIDQPGWRDLEDEYKRWEETVGDIKKSNTQEEYLASKEALTKMGEFWNSIQTIIASSGEISQDIKDIDETKTKTNNLQEKLT